MFSPTPIPRPLIAIGALASLCFCGVLPAQVTFTALGVNTGRWTDVANDGSVVGLGYSGGLENFRWTQAGGAVGFTTLPHYIPSRVFVSGDASAVIGTDGDTNRAFRYTSADGTIDLGSLPGRQWYSPRGISSDGKIIVGVATNPRDNTYPTNEAFRWTRGEGMTGLGASTGANAVSADGSVVAGNSTLATGEMRASRWTRATGMVPIGNLNVTSDALGFSSDGSLLVGYFQHPDLGAVEAFRWTANAGMVGLGQIEGTQGSMAYGAADDGSVIIGELAGGGGGFIWTPESGMRDLLDVLNKDYGLSSQTENWDWIEPLAITPDGRYIAGIGAQGSWLLDRGLNPPPIGVPVEITPAPESSVYGAAASVMFLGLAAWRQRTRTKHL